MEKINDNFVLDLSSKEESNVGVKLSKEVSKFNKLIEKGLSAGKYIRINPQVGGFIFIVEKQKPGTDYDFQKLCASHTFANPKIIIDYLFGEVEITDISPETVLQFFIAKHGTVKKAIKEINLTLNQKSN